MRMCLSCGLTVSAEHDRGQPGPGCKSPDACTFDLTPEEAWQHWRKEAHDLRAEVKRLTAERDAREKTCNADYARWQATLDGWAARAERAEADLAAARAARTVKVKPLVWEEWQETPVQVFHAPTILGRYKVQKSVANMGWMVVLPNGNITSRDTETAAKAAAQADYEARILAALDMGDTDGK